MLTPEQIKQRREDRERKALIKERQYWFAQANKENNELTERIYKQQAELLKLNGLSKIRWA